MTNDAPRRTETLLARVRAGGPALVALSGGVDSGLVASVAHEALAGRVLAVTLTGPANSRHEIDRARQVARAIGVEHRLVEIDPLARAEYRANPSDRCFFCRTVESEALLSAGALWGAQQYLDGVHLDDLGDHRPGLVAMDRAGFRHPLAEAGWHKVDVRAEARHRDLPNWDAPSEACLASRIRHGQPISAELLARVEAAEELVRAQGFRQVRVRVEGTEARIEVDPKEVPRLVGAPLSVALARAIMGLGFDRVTIDPVGYGRRVPTVGAP
ncbi:MAG: ATP-dependent sacrificial sulfur transferase LarE [Thermoplasmata archaeon]